VTFDDLNLDVKYHIVNILNEKHHILHRRMIRSPNRKFVGVFANMSTDGAGKQVLTQHMGVLSFG